MTGEQAVHKANPIEEEQTEAKTYETGSNPHDPVPSRKSASSKSEGQSDSKRDQHHPGDCPDSKKKQVSDGPPRIVDSTHH